MRNDTLVFDGGQITFRESDIEIIDDAFKKQQNNRAVCFVWFGFGILSVLRYIITGDHYMLWAGVFISLGHFIYFIITFFNSTKGIIQMNEIDSFSLKKQFFGHSILEIKLVGNKKRTVKRVDDISEELEKIVHRYSLCH